MNFEDESTTQLDQRIRQLRLKILQGEDVSNDYESLLMEQRRRIFDTEFMKRSKPY